MAKTRRVPRHPWLNSPAAREWRRRLRTEYRRVTISYVQAKHPATALPSSGRLPEETRANAIRYGRAGLEHVKEPGALTTAELKKRHKGTQQQVKYLDALELLLTARSLRSISVSLLVETAKGTNDSFYSTFPSGIDGLFCCWATHQLDSLTATIRQVFEIKSREQDSVRQSLEAWMEEVYRFVMQRPNGRMLIPVFLVYELDSVGEARVQETRNTPLASKNYELRVRALTDLTARAAAFHRAGARSIYELQRLFERVEAPPSTAARLWPDSDHRAWNLALSFWQSMLTCLISVGVMDAERDAANHRQLMLDVWYRGAFSRRRQHGEKSNAR